MTKICHAHEGMTLECYFREQLASSAKRLDPAPGEDTLWYTGSMLARFGETEQLFGYDRDHGGIRPLALLYKDALETRDPRQRCLILRQLGDVALFLGALFPQSFARRGIYRDYFVGMGGGAYDYLAENARHSRHVFSELSAMFTHMLQLIADVCVRRSPFDSTDILKLYQRWRQTGDERLARQLNSLGVTLWDSARPH